MSMEGGLNRPVVRAACLNCRQAKRRCDGVAPLCGPCASRGIQEGACHFVSSKRGGPRYKGVKGTDALRIKAEKERQKEVSKRHRVQGATHPHNNGDSGSVGPSNQAAFASAGPPQSHAHVQPPHHEHHHPYQTSYWHHRGHNGGVAGVDGQTGYEPPHVLLGAMNLSMDAPLSLSGNYSPATSSVPRAESSLSPGSLGGNSPASPSASSTGVSGGASGSVGGAGGGSGGGINGHAGSGGPLGYFYDGEVAGVPNTMRSSLVTNSSTSSYPGPRTPSSMSPNNPSMDLAKVARMAVGGGGGGGSGAPHHMGLAPLEQLPPDMSLPQYGYQPENSEELSFANLQLWQRIQEAAEALPDVPSGQVGAAAAAHEGTNPSSVAASPNFGGFAPMQTDTLRDFFSKLEDLPNTTVPHESDMCPLRGDDEGADENGSAVDNEQQARSLLTAFFKHVYPTCPVLLSPSHLSSLAFYFSGKGPCALFAAISALVAQHVPASEAYRTLRQQHGSAELPSPASITSEEIAAHHARTSAFLLRRFAEQQGAAIAAGPPEDASGLSCTTDETGRTFRLLCAGSMDMELLQIEAAAAHTLLAHYYYGNDQENGHLRAYQHSLEAWNGLQALDIKGRNKWNGFTDGKPGKGGHPFTAEQKEEWAKRVYWASYSTATVLACTGGYEPLHKTVDALTDLQLRPSLEGDIAAWGVLIRGTQHVSRTYRMLFDFERLRLRGAELAGQAVVGDGAAQQAQAKALQAEASRVFSAMIKVDSELLNYTRFDPSWRKVEEPLLVTDDAQSLETQLAQSLRFAGKLMTSGAMIILHRGQAFSNARVFVEATCGMPETARYDPTGAVGCSINQRPTPDGMAPSASGQVAAAALTGALPAAVDQTQYGLLGGSIVPPQFAGGPFDPSVSQDRCRLASATMVAILHPLLASAKAQPPSGVVVPDAPILPPYSACSFVLAAYAILMECLLLQVVEGRPGQPSGAAEEAARKVQGLRKAVRDIEGVLSRFATVWKVARRYKGEVAMLLAANEGLDPTQV